jgi:hypothetical protein
VKLLNLAAGFVKSKIGNPVVGSMPTTIPVAWRARNVDWSECVWPGVCPDGSPLAFPHTQPTISGWIVAEPELVNAAAAQTAATNAKSFRIVPPLVLPQCESSFPLASLRKLRSRPRNPAAEKRPALSLVKPDEAESAISTDEAN